MRNSLAVLCGAVLVLSTSGAGAAGLQGDYVEARTADVFTGPCISNAEVFITGNQAVMAWKVNQGTWKGTDLSGLCVAAAVRGTTTFSADQPDKAVAVLIVDQKASSLQREALIKMAQELGGARLGNVVAVKTARMSLKLENHEISAADQPHSAHGCRTLQGLVLGSRPGQYRDPSPGRKRSFLWQRGDRLHPALAAGQGLACLHVRPRIQGHRLANPLE